MQKKSKGRPPSLRSNPMYSVALARGGSYLASTVSEEARAKQLTATVESFTAEFGESELPFFLEELQQWLSVRDMLECAKAVAYFREHGSPPAPKPAYSMKKPKVLPANDPILPPDRKYLFEDGEQREAVRAA